MTGSTTRYGSSRDEWGYSCDVPSRSTAVWGARAIFKPSLEQPLDLLPGRQSAQGEDADILIEALNGGVLDKVQAKARHKDSTSDAEFSLYDDALVRVIGSPNGSYGYFYLTAYLKPGVEVIERRGECTLYRTADSYVLRSPETGAQTLSIEHTDAQRLAAHWRGFLGSQAPADLDEDDCEGCGRPLDPERGHSAPVCDDECLHYSTGA